MPVKPLLGNARINTGHPIANRLYWHLPLNARTPDPMWVSTSPSIGPGTLTREGVPVVVPARFDRRIALQFGGSPAMLWWTLTGIPTSLTAMTIHLVIEAWPDTSSSGQLCSFGSSGGETPIWIVGNNGSAGVMRSFYRSDGGASASSEATITPATCQSVTAALDTTDSLNRLFVNGLQVATSSLAGVGGVTVDRLAVGGLRRSASELHMACTIAGVTIWLRALNAGEVLALALDPDVFLVRPRRHRAAFPTVTGRVFVAPNKRGNRYVAMAGKQ